MVAIGKKQCGAFVIATAIITFPLRAQVLAPVDLTGEVVQVAATPSASPGSGTVPQTVTLTDSTPGSTIYYTTNGTTPTTSSSVYSTPLSISTAATLKAIAAAAGYVNSSVGTWTYTSGGTTYSPSLISSYATGVDNAYQQSNGGGGIATPFTVTIPAAWPFVGGSNNCAVLVVHANNSYTIDTPSGWTAGPTAADSTNGRRMSLFYKLSDTAATSSVVVTIAGTTPGTGNPYDYAGGWMQEFTNCGSVGGSGSVDSATAGTVSLTLSSAPASGDLALGYFMTATVGAGSPTPSVMPYLATLAPGSGFTNISNQLSFGKIAEMSTSTTNTTVSAAFPSGAGRVIGVGLVIHQGAAGNPAPLTAFIDHHQVEQVQSQNPTYNFPATGQLLVGLMGAQTGVISSMTASNSFSCSPGINNTGAGVTAQVAYCTGTAATASQTISPAFNTTPGPTPAGVELSLTSVSNFPNATVDVQSDGTGDQTTPTAFNTNPPISLTPSQENDVMFMTASVYWHTLMSTQTDANGHTPTFLAASMSKGDDAPTSCTAGTPNSTLDEDNAYGFYQNTSDTTAVSFEFGGSQTSGGCTTNPSGVSSWGAAAIAFKSGTVVNLSACDSTTVQNALNAISADNTTINLPAATCPNYTTPVSVTTPYSFTLAGKSTVATTNAQGNPATFTDSTIITDAQGNPAITLIGSGSASQAIRMTGITFAAPTTATYNGVVKLQSTSSTPGTLRLDHSHFVNIDDLAVEMDEPVKTALADHNMVDVPSGDDYNGIRVYNKGGDGYGDTAWANGAAWGTAAGVFIENNTFNYGFMNDCALGGYYIARYNTFNIPTGNINIGIQSHGVGSQPQNQRGCLGWEVYQNTVGGGGTISASLEFQTSGTGFVWGNNIPSANVATGSHDVVLNYNRVNANTYAQVATPNGWGYCGTAYNGTGSCWDGGGAFASNGYPCLDQLGRGGPSNLLSGTFPTLVNTSTSSCSWPNELLKPVYIFDEGFGGSASIVSVSNGQINPNVDYYSPATSFTGATGTGYGLYSAIPTTCTAGVGYWATDQTTLYTCGAGNVWSSYYTPYTYPHPLDH